jgi:LCP family protein required for cell wall assembly
MSEPPFEPDDAAPTAAPVPPRVPRAPRPPRVSYRVRVGVRALCASASLVVLLASGVAWATFQDFQQSIPHGEVVPADLTDPDGSAQNILLVGNDTRAGATSAELKALHTGQDHGTANADTMMVLHIPAGGGRPTLVSFPRDSWVTIPGYGKGKINAAYPDGYQTAKARHLREQDAQSAGLIQTIKTIHALTGLHIDHYMQVSLLGFYRISNAIGGVTVCLNAAQNPTTDRDEFGHGYSGINLPKGISVIKGKQALAFVRQRHGLPHGDLDRIKRQQYFLKAAFEKITSAGVLLNPFKMRDLLDAVGKSLLVDPKLNLISLARQFESLTTGKINFATIPNNGPQLIYPDGVETAIVGVNRAAIPAFIKQLDGKTDQAFAKARPARPSTVTVDVLNGANIQLLASHNAAALKRFGFRINVVDSTTTTPRTVVEYPSGKETQAKAVQQYVPHAKAVATPDVARVTLVLGTDGYVVKGLQSTVANQPTTPRTSATRAPADPTHGLGCID